MPWNSGDQNWFGVLAIFFMALWGGFVSYFGRVRRGEVSAARARFEFVIDIATSCFSGLLIGLPLLAYEVNPMLCIAVAGVGGHAGARLIFKLECLLFDRVDSLSKKK